MFQKFYEDTLMGRFIKSLLAQTPVPIFSCVNDEDHLVKDCYYIYKQFMIRCIKSGVLSVSDEDLLFPSDNVYPSSMLTTGSGLETAEFKVISLANTDDPKTHAVYNSKSNYYDSETHYHLGRYLRYLYTTNGLNLFPFYNCYNGTYFSDVELVSSNINNKSTVSILRTEKQQNKVVAIPILFGHKYTIAIDCPTQVLIRASIHDKTGYVLEANLPKTLSEKLSNSGRVYNRLQFHSPIKFELESFDAADLMFQNNLYLVIQLPLHNNSSIVVLENYDGKDGVRCDEKHVKLPMSVKPSLLAANTRQSYAFSDRLIEYLIGNVIHNLDPIPNNIKKAQEAIENVNPSYKQAFLNNDYVKGVFDSSFKQHVLNYVEDKSTKYNLYDQDGFYNKDLEHILSLGG